jgi:nitric-oxide synthase
VILRNALLTKSVDAAEAEDFLRLFHTEVPATTETAAKARIEQVRDQIAATGSYTHTPAELAFGATVAWRNSARCIGRLYWRSLRIRDRREVTDAKAIADECAAHLREAGRDGRIRPSITIFAPDTVAKPGPRIWNEQLIRYAAYRTGGEAVCGDRRCLGFTDLARELGWTPPVRRGPFDVLPLVVEAERGCPRYFELPGEAVLEVSLSHPDYPWFAEFGLRWHAVPAISNMRLVIGGITYPAAPFNGWYMGTEIGARNLGDVDRYDLLPSIAEGMGLSTQSERTLWRDRAVVELTVAVQHSFDAAGVTITDHHTESKRFLTHLAREEEAGRSCRADWSWIVPPISGSQSPVFHRYYDEPDDSVRPAFLPGDPVAALGGESAAVVPARQADLCEHTQR